MTERFRVIDLFAGAGGLTQGWHTAAVSESVDTLLTAAVEFDRFAASTYGANFGQEATFALPIESWLESAGEIGADVILGGPPCQGFSALGKRDIDDPRNTLWRAYAETIVRPNPTYFIIENVPPFLKSVEFESLKTTTEPGGLLADYRLEPFVVTSADYGAFQNRRRAVVIGSHKSVDPVGLPATTHHDRWLTVREAFEGIPERSVGYELPDRSTQAGLPGPFRTDELHFGRNYSDLSLKRFAHIPKGGNRHDLPDDLLANCWRGNRRGASDVMGRLHWDRPSVTIRTEFFKPEKGRFLHPEQPRAITHFEAARLQGFPDDFMWVGKKTDIARQIGNAVPVQLGEALSRHIIKHALGRATASTAIRTVPVDAVLTPNPALFEIGDLEPSIR